MPKKETWIFIFAALGGFGGLACILQWLEITPKDLSMTKLVGIPHVLWLITGLALFAASLWSSLRSGFIQKKTIKHLKEQLSKEIEDSKGFARRNLEYRAKLDELFEEGKAHRAELENSQEAYRQCMVERSAFMQGAKESMAKLAMFSSLQIEAFQLAKEMRGFLGNFEPIPPPIDYGATDKQKIIQSTERSRWRQKIMSAYELQFADRKRKITLEFGALGFPMALSHADHGIHEPIPAIEWEADVITAMAHRIDGAKLTVER
ncbi:MAG: hypothetical protein WCA10_20380 [Terracidiphilus sp.]